MAKFLCIMRLASYRRDYQSRAHNARTRLLTLFIIGHVRETRRRLCSLNMQEMKAGPQQHEMPHVAAPAPRHNKSVARR